MSASIDTVRAQLRKEGVGPRQDRRHGGWHVVVLDGNYVVGHVTRPEDAMTYLEPQPAA